MSTRPRPRPTDLQDAEIAEYQALSGLAVVGLICGLLSPIWMIDPLVWIWVPAPPLGILFSGLALWQIARNAPALVGRKAALAGLILSILFGVAAPTNWLGYRWAVRREAKEFARQWFDFLSDGQPQKAYQLTLHPTYRQPLDETLWGFYRDGPHWREELENYVSPAGPDESPRLVRTLLALGEKAQVRYYQTQGQAEIGEKDVVYQAYAVTYDDEGEKKTFFVSLQMERIKLDTGRANWQLIRTEDGFKPEEL